MNTSILRILLIALFIVLPATVGAESPTMCTMQYQPVCGAKQVQCVRAPCYPVYHTYGNSCVLGVEKGTYIHEGECTEAETGPVKPKVEPYTPPAGCTAWFDGCNACSKTANGQYVCTLKACQDTPAPGYCTAYAPKPTPPVTTTPPLVQPVTPGEVLMNPDQTASSSPASDTSTISGFFASIWNMILSWFNWL